MSIETHEQPPRQRFRSMKLLRRSGVRRHRKRANALAVIPTLFTLGNLVAGFAAIHYAAKPSTAGLLGPWGWSSLTMAGALVFLGMFLDAVDGSVARLTRSTSGLGAQLDSLADVVTFGVAPAFMMLQLVSQYLGSETAIVGPEADNAVARLVWGVAAVYVCGTALRLAKFNMEDRSAGVEDHLSFSGLPSPGAAGCVTSLIMLHQHWLVVRDQTTEEVSLSFARWVAFGMPLVTLLCAFAMVSSIRYVHMTNRYTRGRRSFAYVARIVMALGLAVFWPHLTLAVAFTAYALSGPIRWLWKRPVGSPPAPGTTISEPKPVGE